MINRRFGFTIVELLIVIVVIGILAAITIAAYNGIQSRAKLAAAQSAAQQAGKKVTAYAISNADTLPSTLATAGVLDSGGTTYQYTLNTAATPDNYCITATDNGASVHIAGTPSAVFKPVEGPCGGHTGTSPITTLSGACPANYVVVPGSSLYGTDAFCIMKYEAKNDGAGNAITQANPLLPWASITQTAASTAAAAACAGCHLTTEAEWLTVAQNVLSVASNWSGGSVGSGYVYSGHNDGTPNQAVTASVDDNNGWVNTGQTSGNQRRTLTLTNGEVIWDFAGNVIEWTAGTVTGAQPGAAGYGWRQFNSGGITGIELVSPSIFPVNASSSASSWTSSNGIGQLYSSNTELNLRAFRRGGNWADGAYAGVYMLQLGVTSTYVASDVGFRVAR